MQLRQVKSARKEIANILSENKFISPTSYRPIQSNSKPKSLKSYRKAKLSKKFKTVKKGRTMSFQDCGNLFSAFVSPRANQHKFFDEPNSKLTTRCIKELYSSTREKKPNKEFKKTKIKTKSLQNQNFFPKRKTSSSRLIKISQDKLKFPIGIWYQKVVDSKILERNLSKKDIEEKKKVKFLKRTNISKNKHTYKIDKKEVKSAEKCNRRRQNTHQLLKCKSTHIFEKTSKDCIINNLPKELKENKNLYKFKLPNNKQYNQIFLKDQIEKIENLKIGGRVAILKSITPNNLLENSKQKHEKPIEGKIASLLFKSLKKIYLLIEKLKIDILSISRCILAKIRSTNSSSLEHLIFKTLLKKGRILNLENPKEKKQIIEEIKRIIKAYGITEEAKYFNREILNIIEEIKKLTVTIKKKHYNERIKSSKKSFKNTYTLENSMIARKNKKLKTFGQFGLTETEELVKFYGDRRAEKKNILSYEVANKGEKMIDDNFWELNCYLRDYMQNFRSFEYDKPFICVDK